MRILTSLAAGALVAAVPGSAAGAQESPLPSLRDRGTGIPASMSGLFLERGRLLVYPFYAYSRDDDREYQPVQLGYGLDRDFRGRFRSHEQQLFLGYGVTDWLAVEIEASYIDARLDRAPDDPSGVPPTIRESGFADLEAQVRLRLAHERGSRPEIFGFVEVTPRSQSRKVLINESNWDLKPGLGLVRGFAWGTLLVRAAAEWNREASSPDVGEVAIEYYRRVSTDFRVNLGIEGGESGAPDEFELISGVQWRLGRVLTLKLDSGFGLSSKATDWSPQIGAVFAWPR